MLIRLGSLDEFQHYMNSELFIVDDVGSLAMIGQNLAVVDLGFIKLTGFIAWVFWLITGKEAFIEPQNINNNNPYKATETKQPINV
jgi:NADH dehydrogenase